MQPMLYLEFLGIMVGIIVGGLAIISSFFAVIKFYNKVKRKKKLEALKLESLADHNTRSKEDDSHLP